MVSASTMGNPGKLDDLPQDLVPWLTCTKVPTQFPTLWKQVPPAPLQAKCPGLGAHAAIKAEFLGLSKGAREIVFESRLALLSI